MIRKCIQEYSLKNDFSKRIMQKPCQKFCKISLNQSNNCRCIYLTIIKFFFKYLPSDKVRKHHPGTLRRSKKDKLQQHALPLKRIFASQNSLH